MPADDPIRQAVGNKANSRREESQDEPVAAGRGQSFKRSTKILRNADYYNEADMPISLAMNLKRLLRQNITCV